MSLISVVIPYRNRLENLKALVQNLGDAPNLDFVDFWLVSLGDDCQEARRIAIRKGLNYRVLDLTDEATIGHAHNFVALTASSKFILKQDVDCLPFPGFYKELTDFVRRLERHGRRWANLGVYYCSKWCSDRFLSGRVSKTTFDRISSDDSLKEEIKYACGNCFLVERELYLSIGGTSEGFRGWGWEDYQVLYFLKRHEEPSYSLKGVPVESIVEEIREEIARPSNKLTNDENLIFLHRWHAPESRDSRYFSYIDQNRRHLHSLIKKDKLPPLDHVKYLRLER